jgi:hypothetical protein
MASGAELTELLDIKVRRQDGVKDPASGFPILVMKAVNAVGGIDEKPDIALAHGVLQDLAKLIQNEAAEMAVGEHSEIWDIQNLVEAACLMRCFLEGELYGDEDDGEMLKSAGDGLVFKAHRKFSSDERKSLASEGKALPDGSYPIPDEDALRRAAILARSGHGDVAAAKRLIAKRAKELGVANPLANDTKKDAPDESTDLPQVRDADSTVQVQDGSDGVNKDTETSEGDQPEDGDVVAKQIADAVAEATKADRERMEALAAEVAKMRETPIPGGPMLAPTASQRDTRAKSDLLAKAAYHRRQANAVGDRQLARFHREKAAEAEASANA